MEVPNFGGVRYTLGRLRTAIRIAKPMYRKLNLPEHLYYFTIDTLTKVLATTGFDVVSWCTYGKQRRRRKALHRAREWVRDGLKIGNKLRVVARRRST